MAVIEKTKRVETDLVASSPASTRAWDFSATADNDNDTASLSDENVLKAARLLVSRHTPQAPIELSAFDTPHNALAEISEKLEELSLSHAVSQSLMQSLKSYVLESGGSFARAANAKPISVYMVVRNTLPPRRFDNGVTEVAFIGRKMAKVEGASSINVRLTATGTAMTSNAADVDAMFAGVNETGLWLRFEAPTKEDLDGLLTTMEAGLASAVQAVGGAMDAQDLKKLLETLQKEDVLIPQVESLITNLIALQDALNGMNGAAATAEIPVLLKKISAALSNPDHVDLIPPVFAQAVLATLQSLSTHPAMPSIMAENGFGHLVEAEQTRLQEAAIDSALQTLGEMLAADTLEPQAAQAIAELITDITAKMEAGDTPPLEILENLKAGIETLSAVESMPVEAKTTLETMVTEIKSVLPETSAAATDPALMAQASSLFDIISEIAQKIESGEITKADLPENMAEILDTIIDLKAKGQEIGREEMVAEIVRVLEDKADTDFSIKIENVVLTLARPEFQTAMPAELSQRVQTYVRENPSVIEAVATHSVVRELSEQIKSLPPQSQEAQKIRELMDTIKAEGLSAVILKQETLAALPPAIQAFIKENPSVVEAVATQVITRELSEQMKSLPAQSQEAQQIRELMDIIKAEGLSAVILKQETLAVLPPAVQAFINENPSVAEAVATQVITRELSEQMKSLPAQSQEAQQIRALMDTIKAEGLSAVILKQDSLAALPPAIQTFIKENPSVVEAVTTQAVMRELSEQVKSLPAHTPEAQQLREVLQTIKAEGFAAVITPRENQAPLPPKSPEAQKIQDVVRTIKRTIKAEGIAVAAPAIAVLVPQLKPILAAIPKTESVAPVVVPKAQTFVQTPKKEDTTGNRGVHTIAVSALATPTRVAPPPPVTPSAGVRAVVSKSPAPSEVPVVEPAGRVDPKSASAPAMQPSSKSDDKKPANDSAPDTAGKDKPCGDVCRCKDPFNKNADDANNKNDGLKEVNKPNEPKYEDRGDTVVKKYEDGREENLTHQEAFVQIRTQMIENGVDQKQWDKFVDKHDGNALEAKREVEKQIEKDGIAALEVADKIGGLDIDTSTDDRVLMEKIKMLKELQPTPPIGGPDLPDITTEFGHTCNAGCNHGPSVDNSPVSYSAQSLDTNSESGRRAGFKGAGKARNFNPQ